MIYAVTCNPALDCAVRVDRLVPGGMNRTRENTLTPSGKGVNVARVLAGLSVPAKAMGFTAGDTGVLLDTLLRRAGVDTDFTRLPTGSTRINVKLHAEEETELNAPGAAVSAQDLDRLRQQLACVGPGDTVCLCGSLPPGLPADTYAGLLVEVQARGAYTVLDAAGEPLRLALPARPWLIKPNRDELSELMGVKVNTLSRTAEAAAALQRQGARHVLVSLGGEGALLCTEEGRRYYLPAPAGAVRGTVGAGDSMVAGFVTGWVTTGSLTEALRMGVAAGSATAFAGELAAGEQIQAVWDVLPAVTDM